MSTHISKKPKISGDFSVLHLNGIPEDTLSKVRDTWGGVLLTAPDAEADNNFFCSMWGQVATVTAFMCIRNFPSACFTSRCATLCREYSLIRKSKSLYKSDSDSWDIQNIQWYKIWLCVLNLTFLASWPAVTRDSSPLRCGSQTHHSSCEVYCSESQWCVCDEKQHFYHFSDTLLFLLPDENTHGHTRSPSHVKEDPPVMIWFFTVQD